MIEAERNGASQGYLESLKRIFDSNLRKVFQSSICDASKARIPALKVRVKKEFVDDTPPVPYVRKYTDEQLKWLGNHLKELEERGIISKCSVQSPYLAPMQLVAKKKKGDFRLVVGSVERCNRTVSRTFSNFKIDLR